jgi:hypothetical protein
MDSYFKIILISLLGKDSEPFILSESGVKNKLCFINGLQRALEIFKTLFWIVISILTALLIGQLN